MSGKTLGVVGLGAIGTRITEIGHGIGMTVIGYNTAESDENMGRIILENIKTFRPSLAAHKTL